MSPYLYDHAMRAATHFGNGTQASITFRHHRAVIRAASSDDASARCDQVEALTDDGPCVLAMERLHAVLIPHLDDEPRWANWRKQAAHEGFNSALAIGAHVAPGMDVSLNLYSPATDPWDARALVAADGFTQRIARTMSLGMQLSDLTEPLERVELTGPELIGQAVGATMDCNGCTADHALELLIGAAANRNVGLEEVAATVLLALTGVQATTLTNGESPESD